MTELQSTIFRPEQKKNIRNRCDCHTSNAMQWKRDCTLVAVSAILKSCFVFRFISKKCRRLGDARWKMTEVLTSPNKMRVLEEELWGKTCSQDIARQPCSVLGQNLEPDLHGGPSKLKGCPLAEEHSHRNTKTPRVTPCPPVSATSAPAPDTCIGSSNANEWDDFDLDVSRSGLKCGSSLAAELSQRNTASPGVPPCTPVDSTYTPGASKANDILQDAIRLLSP